jgi:hypothetical protein
MHVTICAIVQAIKTGIDNPVPATYHVWGTRANLIKSTQKRL